MHNVVSKMRKDIWNTHQSHSSHAQQGSSMQAGPASQHRPRQDFSQLQKQAQRRPQGHQKVPQQQKQHNPLPQAQRQVQQQQQHQQQQQQHQEQQQRRRHKPRIQRQSQGQHTITTQAMPAFPLQQTAVSKIKRSIFNLPPSMAELVQDASGEPQQQQQQQQTIQQRKQQQTRQANQQFTRNQHSNKTTTVSATTSDLKSTSSNDKDGAVSNGEKTKDTTNGNNELQRMYGYFRCDKCKQTWRSSHVYCKAGSKQAEFGQICKNCGTLSQPKGVKQLLCSSCGKVNCDCPVKREPLLDPKFSHRKDLCPKCQSGDLCVE